MFCRCLGTKVFDGNMAESNEEEFGCGVSSGGEDSTRLQMMMSYDGNLR
jgi:hypothetical protein